MLVYTRKETVVHKANGHGPRESQLEVPTPPPRVLDVVNALNAAHDEACEARATKSELYYTGCFL